MDREDWMYVTASLLLSTGAALYSYPAGLLVLGVMLLVPLRGAMAGRRKETK